MALFRDEQDAQVFRDLLVAGAAMNECMLWAYLLMTNHFHAAIRGNSRQLARCMHFVEGMYALYHNKRYGLSGAAFEGRYEAYPQASLPLLLRTIAYIFANPVAAGMVSSPSMYSWSSYSSFFGADDTPLSRNAGILLRRVSPDPSVARGQLRMFIDRELNRIERKVHRAGVTAKDLQANHFDWLYEQAVERVRAGIPFEALPLAVHWAKSAGFHSGAIRLVVGGAMSPTLRGNVSKLRKWIDKDPANARLAQLP